MENWRNFFESSEHDIWTVIEKAIGVAAAYFPQELRIRRDGLTERMYTAHLLHPQDQDDDVHPRGSDKTNAISGVYHRDEEQEEENDDKPQHYQLRDNDEGAREMVRDCQLRDGDEEALGMVRDDTRDHDLLAALDEWDQEGAYVNEIMVIKNNIEDLNQPESDMMDHLNKLNDLNISVELLQRTEIGKGVNGLRKHPSRRVKVFAKSIVRSWKELVDDWVRSCQPLPAEANGNDHSAVGGEEEGLPSPPLDEGALLAVRTASLEMSQFFDFEDDLSAAGSGHSPPTSNNLSDDSGVGKGEANIYKVDKHRPLVVESRPQQKSENGVGSTNKFWNQSTLTNGVKPTNGNAVSTGNSQQKPNNDYKKKSDMRPTSTTHLKPEISKPSLATKPKVNGEINVSEKILLAKRRLAAGYQQINEAKRQRTTQALELTDLPKGGGPKSARFPQTYMKPGQNRSWTNGRR